MLQPFTVNRNNHHHNRISKPKRVPERERYFWVTFSIVLLTNLIPFQLARFLARGKHHYCLALQIDAEIPFLPWTVCVYFFVCFVFLFFLYRRVSRLPRQTADRYFCANLLGKIICFFFFVFFPTTMTQPEPNGANFWEMCMRILYWIDEPNNLFPSLHCFMIWLSWVGIRGNKQVSVSWRVSALFMAIVVCISTLTTRQHVLLDVLAGILLAELCWLLAGHEGIRHFYSSLIDMILSRQGRQTDETN